MSLTVLHACDYNDVNSSGDYFRVDIDNLNLTKIIKRDGLILDLKSIFPKNQTDWQL